MPRPEHGGGSRAARATAAATERLGHGGGSLTPCRSTPISKTATTRKTTTPITSAQNEKEDDRTSISGNDFDFGSDFRHAQEEDDDDRNLGKKKN